MLRRQKDEKKAAPADVPDESQPSADDPSDPAEERIAPLEEFRGKADQWMKETAAQLARVATHVQQDEKRQSKLDQRLAEFEDRIQSMLMLTEALSVDGNPFVKSHGEKDPEPTPTPAASPTRRTALTLSDEANRMNEAPQWDSEVEGDPSETQVVRLDPIRLRAHEQDEDRDASPARGHPNDPSFESYAPDADEDLSDAELARRVEAEEGSPFADPTPPPQVGPAEAMKDTPQLDSGSAAEAERRLLLLQWAGLLSRNLHRIDVDAFLETYLHTGWVRPDDVERVRALAADLTRHSGPPAERLNREEMHVRTILLISRLSNRDDLDRRHSPDDGARRPGPDRRATVGH